MAANIKMLSIGSATQDVFLLSSKIFQPRSEHGVYYEHLPLGEKLELDDVIFTTGGNAMNAATTFARQGLDSDYMGVIGVDPAAEAILKVLDDEGIGTRYVHQSDKYKTIYSAILLSPSGERTVLIHHGNVLRADGADLNLRGIAEADWLYVSSVGTMALLEKIVSLAAKNGVKVAFNPSARELAHPDKLRTLLDDVTVLIANKQEMQQVFEGKTMESLVEHACRHVPVAIVSDGPNGAIVSNGEQTVWAGMYEDVKVVDRLGAGDAFGSGFVAMYAQGKSLEECITFASANSTSVVTKIGAKAGILHKSARLHDMELKVTEFTGAKEH
jgi:ribokinase